MFIHDSKKFSPMIKEVSEQYDIDKVYADKAHDNRRSFNLLDNLNIEPAIQIRKNASIRTKGCPLRRDEVLLIKKLGYERCKQLKDMGRRWIAEIVFSSLKRILGEDLLSRKFKAQKIEAGLKVMLYNKFMSFLDPIQIHLPIMKYLRSELSYYLDHKILFISFFLYFIIVRKSVRTLRRKDQHISSRIPIRSHLLLECLEIHYHHHQMQTQLL